MGGGGDRGSRCEEMEPSSLCRTAASLQTGRAQSDEPQLNPHGRTSTIGIRRREL